MKKILFIIVAVLLIVSCGQSNQTTNGELVDADKSAVMEDVNKTYNICNLKDSIYTLYPNIGLNDIQTEKACTYAYMEFTTKFNYYVENIQFKFMQMMPYQSKYIVKFEAGYGTTEDKILVNNGINLCIFGYVNTDVAESLIEGKTYYISGTNVTPYLDLPSGNRYIQNVTYSNVLGDKTLYFGCVLKNININEI